MNDQPQPDRRFCLAPMMDWSDRHCRYFWRLLTRRALLYTEMVTAGALIHGDRERLLYYHPQEHPLALQVGGSDPRQLADCARMAEDWGYDEINLNCGCPSDRVQSGRFGACLMAEPELVADCIAAMTAAVDIPVTVKHRIGIDHQDADRDLYRFVSQVRQAGCRTFIVHARKAWLEGLSPRENRNVPPLQYQRVYRLKAEFPDLEIIINGGIKTLEEAQAHLSHVDGVMMGREAYHKPYQLAEVDAYLYGESQPAVDRDAVLARFTDYCAGEIARGTRLSHMSRHILGLYHGQRGGKQFRRFISENAPRPDADSEIITLARQAMAN